MFITKVLFAAVVGLSGVVSSAAMHGPPVQDEDGVLRLPFHETVKCLNSSALEEHWLTSAIDLQVAMGAELDEYLLDSFAPNTYIRSQGLNITLHNLTHVSKSETTRGFLRQKDYLSHRCELELELTGEAIFAVDKNYTLSTKPPESLYSSLSTRRSRVYSQVAKSLAHDHDTRVTTSVSSSPTPDIEEKAKRRLHDCTSVVKSFYSFTAGEFMCAANGPFFFGFATDGDLGIWKGYRKVWSAGTHGDNNKVVLQPDGNLVVRDETTGVVLWKSRTNGDADSGGEVQIADNGEVSVINSRAEKTLTIAPNLDNLKDCATKLEGIARLMPGERICSHDERYSFGLTLDGVLGIFHGPTQIWSAGTCCKGDGTYAHLQADGNFVLYGGNGDVLWESGTDGAEGASVVATIDTTGTVTIENQDAGKTVTIEPFDDEPIVEEEPDSPNEGVCVEQVSGRIDLLEGEFICSPNGKYRFGITLDGDLALFDGPDVVWSAGTCCAGDGVKAVLQMSDGNLVVLNSRLESLWDSSTAAPENANSSLSLRECGTVTITNPSGMRVWAVAPDPVCLDQVAGDFVMLEGQFICSPTARFRFGVKDSNLSLLDGDSPVWSTGLSYSEGVYAHMQSDGNLVARNGVGDALWKSRTPGNEGSSLRLDESGVAKIVSPAGKVLWSVASSGWDPPSPTPLPPTPLTTSKPTVPPPTPLPPTPSPTPLPPPPTSEPPIFKPPPLFDPSLLPCRDPIQGGVVMVEGELVCSSNGLYKFGLATDGDLALFEGSRKVWSASSCCTGEEVTARMQVDGNLVVKTTVSDQVIWSSKSANLGTGIVSLVVGNDGIVTITDSKLGSLWSSPNASTPTISPPQPTPSPTPSPPPPPTMEPPVFKAPPLDPSLLTCRDSVQGPVLLEQGDFFCSPSATFKFGLAPDGDLCLFEGSRKIWSANTCCKGEEVTARMQVDGNLVVKTTVSDQIIWTSESVTQGIDTASLIVGDDGIATITDNVRGHIWSSAITESERVSTDSLVGKVMAGYQGWFFAKGDKGMNRWIHWSRPEEIPSRSSITIDAWPDLRELDEDELYPTQFTYKDNSNAGLYSSHNAKTTERHTKWMKDYGVHGVFVQRFIGNARASNWINVIDTVLRHVRSGAEKHGRTFVNMYDIGNGNEATIVEDIINDWKHLVDDEHITKSKQYLYHRGRPLVALWGFGFYDRLGRPEQVVEIIDWFQNKAEDKYKATLMGGVPTGWRDLSRDSQSSPAWASIYRSYDVISPWAVGRLADIRTANYHRVRYTEPDLNECTSLGIDYLPVVFPGFSFNNLKPQKPFNEIPRNGGTFMWHQMHNAVAAGSKMIYVAMFDEVDESTAIYKIADNQQQTPREGRFIAADTDGFANCPGDWYLNITGTVAGLVQDGKDVPADMPAYP